MRANFHVCWVHQVSLAGAERQSFGIHVYGNSGVDYCSFSVFLANGGQSGRLPRRCAWTTAVGD